MSPFRNGDRHLLIFALAAAAAVLLFAVGCAPQPYECHRIDPLDGCQDERGGNASGDAGASNDGAPGGMAGTE